MNGYIEASKRLWALQTGVRSDVQWVVGHMNTICVTWHLYLRPNNMWRRTTMIDNVVIWIKTKLSLPNMTIILNLKPLTSFFQSRNSMIKLMSIPEFWDWKMDRIPGFAISPLTAVCLIGRYVLFTSGSPARVELKTLWWPEVEHIIEMSILINSVFWSGVWCSSTRRHLPPSVHRPFAWFINTRVTSDNCCWWNKRWLLSGTDGNTSRSSRNYDLST